MRPTVRLMLLVAIVATIGCDRVTKHFAATTLAGGSSVPFLAQLPGLREVHFDGLPGVTLEGTKVFRPDVQVHYAP